MSSHGNGLAYGGAHISASEYSLHWARLVLGWVTISTWPATSANSAWPFFRGRRSECRNKLRRLKSGVTHDVRHTDNSGIFTLGLMNMVYGHCYLFYQLWHHFLPSVLWSCWLSGRSWQKILHRHSLMVLLLETFGGPGITWIGLRKMSQTSI